MKSKTRIRDLFTLAQSLFAAAEFRQREYEEDDPDDDCDDTDDDWPGYQS